MTLSKPTGTGTAGTCVPVYKDMCEVQWHRDTARRGSKEPGEPWPRAGGCGEQRRAVSVRQTQRLHY